MKKTILAVVLLCSILLQPSCKKDKNTAIDTRPKDIDGNVYDTVVIGTQTWMVQNLKTTRYNDGTAIPNVTNNSTWSSLTTGAYSIYNFDPVNDSTYGKPYNWYAVGTGKLAPLGWHVATDDDFAVLASYLGGQSIAGDKMKATILWEPFLGIINTNSSKFTALPGGLRNNNGEFGTFNMFCFFGLLMK